MVFVLDENKMPLDMCHPARARALLRNGKAAVYRKEPFTIILKQVVGTSPEKSYRIKIDYGSKHTGLALLRGEQVCWLCVLHHRTNIKKRIDQRRGYRRRRRMSNLRYREPRFNNRTRHVGWLPPSLRSRVNNIHVWVHRLQNLVPLEAISYENVKFDTQLMENPEICGVEYQQGTLAGYEVREYLLEKFGRKCMYCGKENALLEVEHIIPKSRGGSSRISNLGISCHDCNQKKGNLTAEEFGFPDIQKRTKSPLRDAAVVTATRWAVFHVLESFGLPVECDTGGRTKFNRIQFGLQKEHYYDAVCVGASTPNDLHIRTNFVLHIKAVGRGNHRRTNVNVSGFPRGYLTRQKRFFGFQTGDMVKAVVTKGKKIGIYIGTVSCRKTGSFDITTKTGRVSGLNYKYFRLLQRADGYNYIIERRNSTSSPWLKRGVSVA